MSGVGTIRDSYSFYCNRVAYYAHGLFAFVTITVDLALSIILHQVRWREFSEKQYLSLCNSLGIFTKLAFFDFYFSKFISASGHLTHLKLTQALLVLFPLQSYIKGSQAWLLLHAASQWEKRNMSGRSKMLYEEGLDISLSFCPDSHLLTLSRLKLHFLLHLSLSLTNETQCWIIIG